MPKYPERKNSLAERELFNPVNKGRESGALISYKIRVSALRVDFKGLSQWLFLWIMPNGASGLVDAGIE